MNEQALCAGEKGEGEGAQPPSRPPLKIIGILGHFSGLFSVCRLGPRRARKSLLCVKRISDQFISPCHTFGHLAVIVRASDTACPTLLV